MKVIFKITEYTVLSVALGIIIWLLTTICGRAALTNTNLITNTESNNAVVEAVNNLNHTIKEGITITVE